MSGVDNRIVTMKFDNAQFEQGAKTSLSTLQKLKEGMSFDSASASAQKGLGVISGLFAKFGIKNPFATAQKGAADLGTTATGVATGGLVSMDGAVTGISNKFLALSTIAITALSNITNKAINTGTQLAKSLTLDPIMQGFHEYETNLNSIQTILSNTGLEGQKGLDKVNGALGELNTYADKTIYNFSEMARNIGTFTAAGVDLDTATSSIKGIANLAAVSGSNSQQASTAMYQLSQAISAGKVGLMDWNSVVNAGMGGKVFQDALVKTAQNMGTVQDSAVKLEGPMKRMTIGGKSFRESIMAAPGQESWLTSDVLTTTLKQLSGDLSDADLAAQGYSKAQIEAIQKQAKMAVDAATKVKTVTQLMDTLKEAVGSGWTKTFQLIFGDFGQAKELFTGLSNYFGGMISDSADARNQLLTQWSKGGGRNALLEGLKQGWLSLLEVLKPIRAAMESVFPPMTAKRLLELTNGFRDFMVALHPTQGTVDGLYKTFRGIFSILDIGVQVIMAVAHGIGVMLGAISDGSGGVLNFTGSIGDVIYNFDQFLKKSGVLTSFFGSLGAILSVPIKLLTGFANILGNLFSGFNGGGADKASGAMDRFGNSADNLATGADAVVSIFDRLGDVLGKVSDLIVAALSNVGTAISSAITPESFDATLDVINTALLGGIVLMVRKFFTGGLNVNVGEGFFSQIKETLGQATGTLAAMQAKLKADVLTKLAIALGVMAASLLVLSTIKSGDLTKALVAMSVGFGVLSTVLVALIKYIGPIGAMKLPLIASSLIMLATAMLILSGAMKILGGMDLYEIARALVAISGALYVISRGMSAMPKTLPVTAAGVLILSIALNVLAAAMKIFATMDWGEMAKGLVGVLGSLTAIAIAMQLMPKTLPLTAAGVLILSGALIALGAAMKIFASMSWGEIAKGLVALAGSLVIIGLAMQTMPLTLPITAAGLVLVGLALNGIAAALKTMGGQSWGEIAKGMVTLGGAILILALGLNAMGPMALIGAAALVVATAALVALTPVLVTLGSLDWMTIIKSLTALAGIFVVLGLAGLVLAPLLPVILGLGAALILIGAGLALAGVGALAFATAFGVIVATGTAGVQVLANILGTIIKAIPGFFAALGKGLISFAAEIAKSGAQFYRAASKLISSMLDAVIKNAPKMGKAFMAMLNTVLKVVNQMSPKIIATGFRLIIGFLSAIEKNIGRIVDIASRIIVNFINGISRNLGRIIQSGVNLIIKFIDGVANAINNNSERMGAAGGRLAVAMVTGMANGIRGAAGAIKDAAMDAARAAWDEVKNFFKIGSPSKLMRDEIGARLPQGMALGIKDDTPLVVNEIGNMGKTAVSKLGEVMKGVDDAFSVDPNLNPTVTPVLDLSKLTKEANKMSDILTTVPIMAGVSYATAADISAMTSPQPGGNDGPDTPSDGTDGGRGDVSLTLELHSPKPIDSVESYKAGKTLISLAKEALK